MLTTVDVLDVAGINGVDWDAVELPSQFMENWCYHKSTIKKFALHYETKEPIPDELFDKIKDSKNYLSAVQMLRQLLFAKTDLVLHSQYNEMAEDVFALYHRIANDMSPMKPLKRIIFYVHLVIFSQEDTVQDITATNGLKFLALMLF